MADNAIAVRGEGFLITLTDGKQLTDRDLIGATLNMGTADGQGLDVRIDAIAPAKEDASILLLSLSMHDAQSGTWLPLCDKDAYGRAAGFPVAGAWRNGHFVADKSKWFITCTSGSEGKCILWGYDPWRKGPNGESLVPYYEACQHMVRADYDGSGTPHTKNGTSINVWDHIGIQKRDPDGASYGFEAGWAPAGAVCVARTRWRDLLALSALRTSTPRLAGPCNEKVAASAGAILFDRSR